MANLYAQTFFGPQARARQERVNSHIAYANGGDHGDSERMPLESAHVGLIAKQTHFYLATVTPNGWPYVQHRGGPAGFVHVLDPLTLGFADFDGNEQFVSAGNIDANARVAMFFVDYPTRTRLKVFGHARVIDLDSEPARDEVGGDDTGPSDEALHEGLLMTPQGRIKSSSRRAIVVDVEAFDMNCRKYIRPRFERETIDAMVAPYRDDLIAANARIKDLEAELPRARA